jgi:hypothetical protein
MPIRVATSGIVAMTFILTTPTLAEPPPLISYQAQLQDDEGSPVTDPTQIRFRIYQGGDASSVPSTGALAYHEIVTVTPSDDGVFTHLIGSATAQDDCPEGTCALTASDFGDGATPVWLEVMVDPDGTLGTGDDDLLLPRTRFGTVAYAMRAGTAEAALPATDCSTLDLAEGQMCYDTDARTFCISDGESCPGVSVIRHSKLYPDIASALDDLSAEDGVLWIDSDEDDPTSFVNTNPVDSDSTGKRDALVIDTRNGGIRFLSSKPEYPEGPTGAAEERVPFVFQVRRNDVERWFDSDAGEIDEWNCGVEIGACSGTGGQYCTLDADCPGGETCVLGAFTRERDNCPSGNSTWFTQQFGPSQYWHSGQCNTEAGTSVNTHGMCSGPHILEVRYPQREGVPEKPVFAVGSSGVAIYAPEQPASDVHWTYLTMFNADDGHRSAKANAPMFNFDNNGFMQDGRHFIGGTTYWPKFSPDSYLHPFLLWVQSDLSASAIPVTIEGAVYLTDEAETATTMAIYDRSHEGGPHASHPQGRTAFAFRQNSVLYLGSFCKSGGSCTDDLDQGQYIEWEGMNAYVDGGDGNETRLGLAAEPSQDNFVGLPDASGTVMLADTEVRARCGSVGVSPPSVPAGGAVTATATVLGLTGGDPCICYAETEFGAAVLPKSCFGSPDTLNLRLFNAAAASVDPPTRTVQFCCFDK